MQYFLSKRFEKEFAKLPKGVKTKAIGAFEKFVKNPKDASLHGHALAGKWKGHYSVNITGDIRAIYVFVRADLVRFIAIGSHSELYE